MKKLKSFFQNHNLRHWTGILSLMALSVASMQLHHSDYLLTSILDEPEYVFEGTVSPFENMLDYSKLESGDRDLKYNDLLAEGDGKVIPHLLHLYDNENLTYSLDNIDWNSSTAIDNMNLQYNITVPFAGNYKMDSCGTNCGSHPGIDWVMPNGTPVRSAAAGEVIKVSEQSTGFGNHVVVETQNAPHPTNENQSTTIYFSYSHLSNIYVNEGDIVRAGDTIALSGDTGTATAPHLDWGLALENVPWTPYWPFTWSEANAAGYDFWSAVNEGLGKNNVYSYMADPAEYVLKYSIETYEAPEIDEDIEVIEVDSEIVEELLEEVSAGEETVFEDEEESVEEELPSSIITMDIASIEVDMPSFIMISDQREIEITLIDVNGDVLEEPQFTDEIEIRFTEDDVAEVNRTFLDRNDFNDGVAKLDLYGELEGVTNIIFDVSGSTFTTTPINVISTIEPFAKFGLASDGQFVPNVPEIVQVQAQDLEGNPTPKISGSGEVELEVIKGEATLSPSKISTKDFTNGIAEVELLSESMSEIVIQVTFGTKVTESDPIDVQEFTDINDSNEYFTAVNYLRTKGTISGYPDGSFQPDREVSRIEGLKFIISGLDVRVSLGKTVSFTDTATTGEWYSDYLATAQDIGIVKGYSDGSFKPTQGVNRVEMLKMLFASQGISLDPVVTEDPAPDVDNLAWYAPAVQHALEMNIFPDANSNTDFNPGQAMTRLEVAEVIYRLLVVIYNDDEPYSVLLSTPPLQ